MTAAPGAAPPRRKADRVLVWYLRGSALAIAVLIVIVVTVVFRLDNVIGAQHDSNVAQCQLANVTRVQDIAIWNRLLRVPVTATAAQKAEVAELEQLVRVKDAPRDCTAAYSGK